MSAKQDRTYARTAQDIERKYSFGKTFADMLGLINDNRDKVDAVESGLKSVNGYLEITEQSTTLKRDTQQIVMEATETVKTSLSDDIEKVSDSVAELKKSVNLKVDASEFSVKVQEEVSKGVSVGAGYTFDSKGLTISKPGEAMTNLLDNTGMYVKKSGDDILIADKDGVMAKDLHAKTYLLIGEGKGRTRIEDYDINRTGLFWIGG